MIKKHKLLVANRSEIACRIFQTAREMGIETIALCAPGDEEARHVTYASEVWPVESYLSVPAVMAAARKSGATLIHPGYGFLSERPIFADAVEKAGIQFIGPRAESMELLGGKIAAKELAERIGVPTLPWAKVAKTQGNNDAIKSAALKVGFPLLLKAAAGGGGKGMRRVERFEEFEEAAESASAEAVSAFGDGTLFLERLVDRPRHIEVQVFGDGTGFGVHLHERECTLQRRHQKVWEEATAPHLSQKAKDGLFEAALKLVKEVKYRNAGTIEFLVDENEKFYFLEMNTRLQVEHPVSELVTGVDLVYAQILQTLYPKSPAIASTPLARGHAIEVRLYAEDAAQGFVPTPGKVEALKWPSGAGIRVDSGIEVGQTLGTQFDSMLAKIIVFAPTRALAVERMRVALEDTVVMGLGTNQAYLSAIASHPKVIEGRVDTGFLGRELGSFYPKLPPDSIEALQAARHQGYARALRGGGALGVNEKTSKPVSPWEVFSL